MLERIDHEFAHIMLSTYLGVCALSIIMIHMHESRRERLNMTHKYGPWLPYVLQFCFGGLFSAYIIFYTQSASLAVSWPFLLFLVLLVLANELLHKRYTSTTFQMSMFFTVLMSYIIFSLPILLGEISDEVFIVSGFVSLAIISFLATLLKLFSFDIYMRSRKLLFLSVCGIYLLFHVAYFTNLIPPVPLSLREIGVYHSIIKEDDDKYKVRFEASKWYPWFKNTSPVFNRIGTEPAYVFASVFAPAKLTTPLFYVWSYFDETDEKWVTTDRISFPIVGGREEGYRGYSVKEGIFPSKWRVDIETFRKQRVGRVEFSVVEKGPLPKLITEIR